MTTLFPPIILAVTRTPIGNAAAPVPLPPAGSKYPTLDQVMDWFDGWVKTFDPALLGVNPEKPIYIYYLRLKIASQPAVEVITPDIMDPPPTQGQNPTPHKLEINTPYKTINSFQVNILGLPTDVLFDEISAFLPDMAALETSKNYVRNALLMGISVQVGTAGGDLSASSLPFPVWLPGPLVREPIWGDIISFGDKDSSMLSQEFISNYLGLAAEPDSPNTDPDHIGGQIRWYSFDQFNLSDFEEIHFDLMDFLHSEKTARAKQLVIALPDAIVPTMERFRRAGNWILPPIYWDDNCVKFYLPDKPNGPERPGYVIIWRDDIPSRPILFVDVEEYILNKLKELAGQLWQPNVNDQAAVVQIPIPLGKLIEMGVERLVDAGNSLLASALDTIPPNKIIPELTVQFKFKLVGVSSKFYSDHIREVNDDHIIDGGYQKGFDPGTVGVSKQKVAFHFKPEISATELPPDQSGAFSLQLSALINGKVTLLNREHTIDNLEVDIGLPVVFLPEPVMIPTLAIFFYDHFFEGPALVTLPKGTGLFGKDANGNNYEIHFDADTPGRFNEEKQAIISKLETIHTVLKAIQMFWGNPTLELITRVLGTFYSIGMSVIETSGEIGNLGDCMISHRARPLSDITFHDNITSVVLIGVPYTYSKTVVKCYENIEYNTQKNGRILDLVLPDDCFIAAIPSFWNLHGPFQLTLVSGDKATIPLPYGNPDEGQPAEPEATFINFNDQVSSIKFEIG